MADKEARSGGEDFKELLEKHPLLDIEKQLYYYGVRPFKEINLSKLKILSIILVISGLLGIYFLATTAPIPIVKIRDVYGNFLMNYATVYVEGVVSSVPYVEYDRGRYEVRFAINDSTGEMNIYIYDPQAREALSRNLIPFPGDHVKALVQIRVRETYTYGILQSLDFLEIERNTTQPVNVTVLSPDMENMYVGVHGYATDIREVGSGILFEVDTGRGFVTVLWPKALDYIYADNKDYVYLKNNLTEGAEVYIKGVVYLYRGSSPEIIPRSIEDIWVKPIIPVKVALKDIGKYVGKYVNVTGVMGGIEYVSGRYSVTLLSEEASVEALFPRSMFVEINPFEIGTGSKIEVIGAVVSETQIMVMKYRVLEARPSPLVKVSDITEDIDGYTIVVKGIIKDLTFTSSYVIFMLEDDTGSIKVFMPTATYSDLGLKASLIREDSNITLAGYVDVYRGALELVVYSKYCVEKIDYKPPGAGLGLPTLPSFKPPAPPAPTIIKVADLSNYIGSTVTVNVYLDSIQYDSNRYIYVLKVHDDTGETYILAKSTPVRAIIDPFVVGCDSLLNVTGLVKSDSDYGIVIDIGGEPGNLQVLSPVTPPKPSISEAKNMELGTIIILENVTVTDFRTTSGGSWILTVTDGNDSITVFVPASVADSIPDNIENLVKAGGPVSIAGYLSEYRGTIELVVYTYTGIKS